MHLLSFYYVPDTVLRAQDKSAKWLILLGYVRTATGVGDKLHWQGFYPAN